MNCVNVFWTSGFDSTYLVCDLVMRGYEVRPFYIKRILADPVFQANTKLKYDRLNEEYEIELLDILTNEINAIGPGKINSPIFIDSKEYKSHKTSEILETQDRVFITEVQYSYLAEYCKRTDQKIAIGLEKVLRDELHYDEPGPGRPGQWLEKTVGLIGDYIDCRPDPQILIKKPELEIIMNWRFPIINKLKRDLAIDSIHRGFHDILKLTTSCRFGSKNSCGECNKCITKKKTVDIVYNMYDLNGKIIPIQKEKSI